MLWLWLFVVCFWMSFFSLLGADNCREDDDSNDESSSWFSFLGNWDKEVTGFDETSVSPPLAL